MHQVRILVVVFAVAVASGFGLGRVIPADDGSPGRQPVAAGSVPPTLPEPVHVVLAGDSVMAGLVPPVTAALESTGRVQVDFILTPAILRDPSVRFTWSQELAVLDPDLVVMFVGTWEDRAVPVDDGSSPTTQRPGATSSTLDPDDPRWGVRYRQEVVDPWLDLITAEGAKVLWIGAPPVGDAERSRFFDDLNEVFASLPRDWPSVTYLDPAPALGASGDDFAASLNLPDGTPVRLRQVDGLHLCPTGAQLLAEITLDEISAELRVPVATTWQDGTWREDQGLYPVEGCPSLVP